MRRFKEALTFLLHLALRAGSFIPLAFFGIGAASEGILIEVPHTLAPFQPMIPFALNKAGTDRGRF